MAAPFDCPDRFRGLLQDLRVPDPLQKAILKFGYETASDFASAFQDPEALNVLITKLLSSDDAADLVVDGLDPLHTPAAARLRRVWEDSIALQPASGVGSTPRGFHGSSDWLDQLPPKLTHEQIKRMVDTYFAHYTSETLSDATMPGTRLLSHVHAMFRPGGELKWIPWKSLVSRKQEMDHAESRPAKVAKLDFLHAFQSAWDEPPALSDADITGQPHKILGLLTVRSNALALCEAAHRQVLRKFDERMMELYTAQLPTEAGMRPPTVQEFQAADRHLWTEIFKLVDRKWKLNEALQEMTDQRNDMNNWMGPRPRAPPRPHAEPRLPAPPPAPASTPAQGAQGAGTRPRKPRGAKGAGKGQKGKKGSGKASDRIPNNWARQVHDGGTLKPICFRFHLSRCTQQNCRFSHKCPVKDASGRVCGGDHRAVDHAPAAPRT